MADKHDAVVQRLACNRSRPMRIGLLERDSHSVKLNPFGLRLLHSAAPACAERPVAQQRPVFAQDDTYVEVVRVGQGKHHWGSEGGEGGCWFYGAPGSGVWLHAGRSLRAKNREALSAALNVTNASEWVQGSWLRRWPYRLETVVGLCRAASRAGYATIQLGTERMQRQITFRGETGIRRKKERCVRTHSLALCTHSLLCTCLPAQTAEPGEIARARDHLLPPRVPRAEEVFEEEVFG